MKKILSIWVFCLSAFTVFSQSSAVDEFTGPFPSWLSVSDYGATGNGVADETSAIQAAFDAIGNDASTASVVYFPAGTYRITGTLHLNFKINISVIGADPASTKIIWDGSSDGAMLSINGTAYSRFNRITWDGKNIAAAAIDQSWDGSNKYFDTGNEYADDVFTDVGLGIKGGFLGNGFAETAIMRCKFIRNTIAGVSLGNFNALDIWIWNSLFEDCAIGVTNIYGAGNFKVYKSIFKNSSISDIKILNTGEFSFRDNTSINSQAFIVTAFTGNPALMTIQGNTVLDPIANTPIEIKNQGPVTFIDNTIRSRSGAIGPLVLNESFPSSDFFSIGNTYNLSNPVQVNWSIVLDNPIAATNTLSALLVPELPATPVNLNRKIYEVPKNASTSDIQNIINLAANSGNVKPIVHFAYGAYSITSTLIIPVGSDIQIVGDGYGDVHPTLLRWTGTTDGPVIRIDGPSKAIFRDFAVNGNGIATNFQINNADQQGSRVFMHQLETRGNETNLLVNGLDHTRVLAYNSGFAADRGTSIDVFGGPLASAGMPQEGRTIIFGGAESNNHLSHKVSNGGNLLVRDVWYESNETGPYLNLTGNGKFAVEGSHITSPASMPSPQLTVNDFSGKALFLGTYISDKIAVTGDGTSDSLLGLSILSAHDTYISNSTSPAANVQSFNIRAVDNNSTTSGSGSYTVNNIGVATPSFLIPMLQNVRNVHVDTLSDLPTGITDIRFYRIWSSNGINGIELQGSNLITPPPPPPPVKDSSNISSINFTCSNGVVILNWQTSKEVNSDKFDVQKSPDGSSWIVVGNIAAAGNSTATKNYSYTDRNTNGASFFYRVVLHSLDDNSVTSSVVKPDCPSLKNSISVFPNPVQDMMTIYITATEETPLSLNLYNSTGSVIKSMDSKTIVGDQQINFDLTGLSNGVYVLHSFWRNHFNTYKIVKQK